MLPQLRPAPFGGVLLVALDLLTVSGAFALPVSNLHHRTLRAVPHRTRRLGDVAAGARARRASPGAAGRRASCARAVGACGARRRRGRGAAGAPAPLGRMRWPVLFLLSWRSSPRRSAFRWGMVVYWLLHHAQAATHPAGRPVAAGDLSAATLTRSATGLAGAGAALVIAAPIGYLAVRYPGPLDGAHRARGLFRPGRAGHRRGARADLADDPPGRPLRWTRACRCSRSPTRSCLSRSRSSASWRRLVSNSAAVRGGRAVARRERPSRSLGSRRPASGRERSLPLRLYGFHLRVDGADRDPAPCAVRASERWRRKSGRTRRRSPSPRPRRLPR